MASLQRTFTVMVMVMVMAKALSSVLAAAARIHPEIAGRVPPESPIEERQGAIDILNQLDVTLSVQCDSDFRHQGVGTIPVSRVGGFEFVIVDQNYWKCSMSAPASAASRALSGTFTLWARNPSFNPGDFVYWLVNKDGLYLVPSVNSGITPHDGTLLYRWH